MKGRPKKYCESCALEVKRSQDRNRKKMDRMKEKFGGSKIEQEICHQLKRIADEMEGI